MNDPDANWDSSKPRLPIDNHTLHELGGACTRMDEIGEKYVRVRVVYLRELLKLAWGVMDAARHAAHDS
jgi:hypothetical protein